MIEQMTLLVLQLGVIIFAARIGGLAFEKIRMPAIIGEIGAGLVIGPYFLGGINIALLGRPLFAPGQNFPVSAELYGFATVASIILLFLIGLETDLKMLLKYSLAGSLVGVGGAVASFFLGSMSVVFLAPYLLNTTYTFFQPVPLFLGVIAATTSVGIIAQILSEKKKMHSPEGATIISAAVIDDILGIIALTVVISLAKSNNIGWQKATGIAFRSIFFWLGFTFVGIILAQRISSFLKKFKDTTTITVMGLGLAFIFAAIFEKAGLAMIIGAYIMGLSLSRTDLDYVLQEKLSSLRRFFVPIFFCVMGMMINLSTLNSAPVILFGLAYTAVAVAAKIIGCGLPSLFLNFNYRGAARIGLGMTPRGEVTLIIAAIGLTAGILTQEILGVVIIMTVITALVAPVLFTASLASKRSVLRKQKTEKEETKNIRLSLPTPDTLELILSKIITAFGNEGFFITRINTGKRGQKLFQIRKNQTFITVKTYFDLIEFHCKQEESVFINTLIYEVICDLENTMHQLQQSLDRKSMAKKIFTQQPKTIIPQNKLVEKINLQAAKAGLKATDKQSLLEEMAELLIKSGQLAASQKNKIIKELSEREKTMSTGMEYGIAIPHIKTSAVNTIITALGTKKEGIDFQSLDGKKSNIFFLILSPREAIGHHIRLMADVSQFLSNPDNRKKLLAAQNKKEILAVFTQKTG